MTNEEMKLLQMQIIKEQEASDRELFAVRAHLEDMRRLVFEGFLPNTLPPASALPPFPAVEKKK